MNSMEKIKITQTVICEGKYDKIKLSSLLDAQIITTEGFSVFNNKEKIAMLRAIAQKTGIVIITDSDGAGFVIRNKLKGMLPKEKVFHLYIPRVAGKEKRKSSRSAEGLLGVEGMTVEVLRNLFKDCGIDTTSQTADKSLRQMTKTDFYELGLPGRDNSKELRKMVCEKYNLPNTLTANALLQALNLLNISVSADDLVSASEQE